MQLINYHEKNIKNCEIRMIPNKSGRSEEYEESSDALIWNLAYLL